MTAPSNPLFSSLQLLAQMLAVADDALAEKVRAERQKNAEEVMALLERLNSEVGKTILMVTHDPKAAHHARIQIHLEKGVLDRTVEVNR